MLRLRQYFEKCNSNKLENRLITIRDNNIYIYVPSFIDPFIEPLKLPFSSDNLIIQKVYGSTSCYTIMVDEDAYHAEACYINSVTNFSHRYKIIDISKDNAIVKYNELLTLNLGEIITVKKEGHNLELSEKTYKKLHIEKLQNELNINAGINKLKCT